MAFMPLNARTVESCTWEKLGDLLVEGLKSIFHHMKIKSNLKIFPANPRIHGRCNGNMHIVGKGNFMNVLETFIFTKKPT